MRKRTNYRRVLALFLTAFMLFACLPVTVLAAENADISEEIQQENQSPQENAGEPSDSDLEDETGQDEPEILQPEEPEDSPEESTEPSASEPEESEIIPAEPDAADQETAPEESTEPISLNTEEEIDALSDLPAEDPLAGFTFWLVKGNQQDCVLQKDETGYYLSLPIGDLEGGTLYVRPTENIADFSVEYEQYVYEGTLITNAHNFVQLLPDRNGSIEIPGLVAKGYSEYTNQITLNIGGESYFVQIRPYCQLGNITVSCGGVACTVRR